MYLLRSRIAKQRLALRTKCQDLRGSWDFGSLPAISAVAPQLKDSGGSAKLVSRD